MRRFAVVLLLCLAVTGTAVAGFSFAGVLSPKATRDVTNVTVHAGEYYFTLSQTTVPAGTVNFTIINDGDVTHDFQIGGKITPTLSKGGTATLSVNFDKAGQYPYLCTIGEHAIYGMQGYLTVTGGTTTSTTTTSTTTTAATTTTPAPTTVPVSEKEFKISLPSTSKKVAYYKWVKVNGKRVHKKFFKVVTTLKPVKAGPVHFVVTNNGKIPHNFVIDNAQTLVLPAGGSGSVDVDLAPGKYTFECSITGHAALGMKGTLVVQ
jgi:uncharacterized cupredoxin-like copper-binding protein